MIKSIITGTISFGLFMATCLSYAQPGGPGGGMSGPGMSAGANKAMMKLFGKHDSFSAKAEMKMLQGNKEVMNMPASVAFLKGKMRNEMDMGQAKGMQMPPQAAAQMKQMGMDKIVNIIRSDLDKMYVVYPGMKGYLEMAMLNNAQSADGKTAKEPKVETSQLGKETVDGHPCNKNKVTITEEDGQKHEMLVWNATDLKDFPIQWQMEQSGNTMVFLYKNVQFSKPDEKLFEAPAGYEKFENQQQMMQKVMQKMMGNQGRP
jgi:hypothetical protein